MDRVDCSFCRLVRPCPVVLVRCMLAYSHVHVHVHVLERGQIAAACGEVPQLRCWLAQLNALLPVEVSTYFVSLYSECRACLLFEALSSSSVSLGRTPLAHRNYELIMSQQDSVLSITASITGILTFVGAVLAGFYARAVTLRNAIDTQAEVASALEKVMALETETDMWNNAYLASEIRHPNRKYGNGDFKYFNGLYRLSLDRMREMDRDLRQSAALVTGGNSYHKISRVKSATIWMANRNRIHRDIDVRKQEGDRIFQVQLAILSAKLDELSYHQKHHNATCTGVTEDIASLQSLVQTNRMRCGPYGSNEWSPRTPCAELAPAIAPVGVPIEAEISEISKSSFTPGINEVQPPLRTVC
ncbi:hypothetical protein BJ875DRAFT_66623 [Amylocarpus encephaloides]|uniref:Uncharacterized protein n=1 Tax=Amylocarpus encephaloides TaxID=45428 RepID=A0A9P7YG14_9HELO|nr:hypothetical protein BJ875DRAFT_66623 [Amylocarpus encephaloides]